jgi:hypothetical protein
MKCPECGKKMVHIKAFKQRDGSMSPEFYGHTYDLMTVITGSVCKHSIKA